MDGLALHHSSRIGYDTGDGGGGGGQHTRQ